MRRSRKGALRLLLALMVAFAICGCDGAGGDAATYPPTPATYEITYRVTGTEDVALVRGKAPGACGGTYFVNQGIRPPWEMTVTCNPGEDTVSIVVYSRLDPPGTLRCEIWVDGVLKDAQDLSESSHIFRCFWSPVDDAYSP